ncbi:HK97-gp10 family putative phage morphogenesis protein [Ligilactobacillus sp. LYQ139]|uniref:HK97-gp10 family putative phage morphogenesis protein n=1 Tax=Ligilactobacillus sp. LYQ139 TaxID=3378800 RepID=UPI0038620857
MSDNELPTVKFGVNLDAFNQVRAAAQALADAGMPEALAEFDREFQQAQRLSRQFVLQAGAKEVDAAQKLESSLVGHSKSRYVPTGTLQGSIKPEVSPDGLSVSVAPHATTAQVKQARGGKADGKVTPYGPFVEFGTYKMAPEPFMKPSGERVANELKGDFENTVRRAIE